MNKKKIILLSVIVLVIILCTIFIPKLFNKEETEEDISSIPSYNIYTVSKKKENTFIYSYEEYLEYIKDLNIDIAYEKEFFDDYNIFVNYETINMCDNDENKYKIARCDSNLQISYYISDNCSNDCEDKIYAFFFSYTKDAGLTSEDGNIEILTANDINVTHHRLYRACNK